MKPVCSIIIPVLNEGSSLQDFLSALQVFRQNHVEIILVDGGSEVAPSGNVSQKVDQLLVVECGRARQMNAGAAVAQGDYLLFLHADTRLPQSFLQFVSRLRERKVKWGFFHPRLSGSRLMLRLVEKGMDWRSSFTQVATGDQALFIRRDVFDDIDGYPVIPLMEDIAITKKLRRLSTAYIWEDPVITSSRRWEQRGIVKTVFLMWSLRLLYVMGISPHVLWKLYYGQ